MNSREGLTDAIDDLKQEIPKRGFSEGLLEEIAKAYGLNPKLLRRKFEEQTRQSPETYRIEHVELSPRQNAIHKAKELATDSVTKGGRDKEYAGEVFTYHVDGSDMEFAFVTKLKGEIVAVLVADSSVRKFTIADNDQRSHINSRIMSQVYGARIRWQSFEK